MDLIMCKLSGLNLVADTAETELISLILISKPY
jgi:hypothetical protein